MVEKGRHFRSREWHGHGMEVGRGGTGCRAQGDRPGLAESGALVSLRYVGTGRREPSKISQLERQCCHREPHQLCAGLEALVGEQDRALLHS